MSKEPAYMYNIDTVFDICSLFHARTTHDLMTRQKEND